MRDIRIFQPGSYAIGDSFVVEEAEARHLTKVLRRGVGESFLLLDGVGHEFEAHLVEAGKRDARAEIVGLAREAAAPRPRVLACALLKSPSFEETLERARKGTFAAIEIQRGLPPALRDAYFTPADGGFRVIARIREAIRFDTYNLLGATHPLRRFDLIFCRNVLVYFDDTSREQVMRRLAQALTPEGSLGLGSTELPVRDVAGLTRMPQGGGWLERSR